MIKELFRAPWLPLGIADILEVTSSDTGGLSPPVYTEQLEPRDRVLLYTDGLVEGRARGSQFGLERLTYFILRHSASGLSAPESSAASTTPSSTTSTGGCPTTPPPC